MAVEACDRDGHASTGEREAERTEDELATTGGATALGELLDQRGDRRIPGSQRARAISERHRAWQLALGARALRRRDRRADDLRRAIADDRLGIGEVGRELVGRIAEPTSGDDRAELRRDHGGALGPQRCVGRHHRDDRVREIRPDGGAALVRRGLRLVIAGAPNVGKSSLLNALAGRKAAIVSEIAGTTRDVVEAALVINGLAVSLSDTAGLRDVTDDAIEREGILRSRSEIDGADILIWVALAGESVALPDRLPELVIHNKSDLVSADSIQLRNESHLAVSVKHGDGLEQLRDRLAVLVAGRTHVSEQAIMVRARHRTAVTESIRSLNDALSKQDDALELMAEDVRKAAQAMASITGRIGVEDFLGRIFSEFCVGK